MTITSQTLADRMALGRIPVGEALRMAMQIADQLRYLQDQGTAHGELTPWSVAVSGGSAQLLSPAGFGVTPYTAPEVLEGRPADSRSDIYAFGAILYEMMTGQEVFNGTGELPPSGSPALDRVVSACLAKAPEMRYQRMQKLMLELKMLASAARRMGPATAAEPLVVPPPVAVEAPEAAALTPMQEFENRIGARMAEQERAIANMAQVANELLLTFRQQGSAAAAPPPVHGYTRQYSRSYGAEGLDGIGDRLARIDMVVSSAVERLQRLEEKFEEFDTDCAALRDSVTRDIRNFERSLKTQTTAIESTRTAMGQTDDLVERVVEALDSLQSMFVGVEERSLAS